MAAFDHYCGVSVIICGYNSCNRLAPTLQHLANQKNNVDVAYEIIVVDNASTDGTAQFALNEWVTYNKPDIPLRVVTEPRPGLIYARFKGVKTARYEYIVFCDDDNWLNEDYLQIGYKTLIENPGIGAAGGFGVAITDGVFPDWFKIHQDAFAVGGQEANVCENPRSINYLWGAGMVTRKSLFEMCYRNFPPLLTGRSGHNLSCGEDAEYTMRLQLYGFELTYNDKLVLRHYIAPERLTTAYRDRLFKEGAESSGDIIGWYRTQIMINRLNRLRKLNLLVSSIFRIVFSALKVGNRWSYDHETLILYFLSGLKLREIEAQVQEIKKSTYHSKKRT